MKNKFLKKITAIFLLLVISSNFFNYNCVHAEINSQYSQNTSIGISDEGSSWFHSRCYIRSTW